jgi:hypothetical protein
MGIAGAAVESLPKDVALTVLERMNANLKVRYPDAIFNMIISFTALVGQLPKDKLSLIL